MLASLVVRSKEDVLSLAVTLNGLVHFRLSFHESRPSNSRESHSLHSLKILGNLHVVCEYLVIFPIGSGWKAGYFTVRMSRDE